MKSICTYSVIMYRYYKMSFLKCNLIVARYSSRIFCFLINMLQKIQIYKKPKIKIMQNRTKRFIN